MTFTLLLLAICALGSALIISLEREARPTGCTLCSSIVRIGDVVLRAYRKDFDNTIICLECEHGRRGKYVSQPCGWRGPLTPAADGDHKTLEDCRRATTERFGGGPQ